MRFAPMLSHAVLAIGAFLTPAVAQVCDLTTIYNSNGGGAVGGAVYVNLVVHQPLAIRTIELNSDAPIGTPIGLQLFSTPNGYNGQILNSGVWVPAAQDNGTGVSAGRNNPSIVPLAGVLVLQPGSYGLALVAVGFGHRFTTGNANNQSYTNPCLTINMGAASDQPFAGGILTPRVWNGTIRGQVAIGSFADFASTTPSGPTPLQVSYTDISYTSSAGGIVSWAWDLDGDGIIDINAANPTFTYSTCGRYNVSLTVSDGIHGPDTITKVRYVAAEPALLPIANFDASVYGGAPPLVVQFTDTSTGSPATWSWDFDEDGIPDSALPNPMWTYTTSGWKSVSLRVANACGNDAITKRNFVRVIANEECTGAVPLTLGLSGTFENLSASTSSPAWACATGGADIWFSFRAPCRGRFQVDTCTGTNYDSAVEVFSGTCANPISIACNDDSCGLSSVVAFSALAGQSFLIRVGGWSSNQGNFRVRISVLGSGTITEVSPRCGTAQLEFDGSANLGSPLAFTVTPVTGTALLWIGLANLGFPLCTGCTLGASIDYSFVQSSLASNVPCDPTLVGGTLFIQGAELGVAGGCPIGSPFAFPLTLTRTLRVRFGS